MDKAPCHCGKPSDTSFSHLGPLCKGCFVDLINKRCRKALKDAGWLQKGQKVHLVLDDTAQGKALDSLFKQVVKGLPLELVALDKAEAVIVGKTADDEAEDFLQQLFSGDIGHKQAAVNLFANLSAAELDKFCELEDIVGETRQKSGLRTRLEALDKKYPGTLFALQKSKKSFE